jgi:hypothetical protein
MEKLNKHKKSNPFKVPEDYFEGLNERIIANCSEANVSGSRRGLFSIKPYLTLAAVISGAAIITVAILNKIPSTSVQEVYVAETLSNAYEYAYDDIDISMIEAAFDNIALPLEPNNTFSDDEIIEYLLTEQVEMSLIYEHFGDGVDL